VARRAKKRVIGRLLGRTLFRWFVEVPKVVPLAVVTIHIAALAMPMALIQLPTPSLDATAS